MSRGRIAAAALSGILCAQAFPYPDIGLLAWVALVPLLAALDGVRPSRGALLGGLQGTIFFAALLYWIPPVIAGYGGLSWPAAVGVGGLLVLVLSLFHAAFGAVQAWLFRAGGGRAALFAAPAAWVLLCEWCRLWPVGGFPWGYLGYTQHASIPLLQAAAWGGVFGLSLLVVSVNVLLYAALASRGAGGLRLRRAPLAAALVLPAVIWGAGWLFLRAPAGTGKTLSVAAIQGNVRQDEKWQGENREAILERHLKLTGQAATAGADLILWPESSTVEGIESSASLRHRLQQIADRASAAILLGSIHRLPGGGYTNAAFLLAPGRGLVDRYDKVRLVPFGETVPLRSILFFVEPLVKQVGAFTPGADARPLGRDVALGGRERGSAPFGVAICYEIIYPQLIARQVRLGATFLTTITNDAWFGRSAAPAQHFAMAVVRAAETRRWLVRAANTGISGVVTPRGEVVVATPLFETRLVQAAIRPRNDLSWAARYPHAVPGSCVMILIAVAVTTAARRPAKAIPG